MNFSQNNVTDNEINPIYNIIIQSLCSMGEIVIETAIGFFFVTFNIISLDNSKVFASSMLLKVIMPLMLLNKFSVSITPSLFLHGWILIIFSFFYIFLGFFLGIFFFCINYCIIIIQRLIIIFFYIFIFKKKNDENDLEKKNLNEKKNFELNDNIETKKIEKKKLIEKNFELNENKEIIENNEIEIEIKNENENIENNLKKEENEKKNLTEEIYENKENLNEKKENYKKEEKINIEENNKNEEKKENINKLLKEEIIEEENKNEENKKIDLKKEKETKINYFLNSLKKKKYQNYLFDRIKISNFQTTSFSTAFNNSTSLPFVFLYSICSSESVFFNTKESVNKSTTYVSLFMMSFPLLLYSLGIWVLKKPEESKKENEFTKNYILIFSKKTNFKKKLISIFKIINFFFITVINFFKNSILTPMNIGIAFGLLIGLVPYLHQNIVVNPIYPVESIMKVAKIFADSAFSMQMVVLGLNLGITFESNKPKNKIKKNLKEEEKNENILKLIQFKIDKSNEDKLNENKINEIEKKNLFTIKINEEETLFLNFSKNNLSNKNIIVKKIEKNIKNENEENDLLEIYFEKKKIEKKFEKKKKLKKFNLFLFIYGFIYNYIIKFNHPLILITNIFIKLILTPLIIIGIITLLTEYNIIPNDDPVLLLTLFVESATPTAMQSSMIVNLNHGYCRDEVSENLFFMYICTPISLTAFTIYYLHLACSITQKCKI
jgi:uncharacterized membrane protein (DUF485 family)